MDELQSRLSVLEINIGRINDLALRARNLGFPILQKHTYNSTLWIMAEVLRQEAELSLSHDIILIDRPLSDAMGYLVAALAFSGRSLPRNQMEELESMVLKHSYSYNYLIATVLDPSIQLGDGRDDNIEFRAATAATISDQLEKWSLDHKKLSIHNREQCLEDLVNSLKLQFT